MQALLDLLEVYVKKYDFDYAAIRNEYCECGIDDYYKFIKILKEIEND